MALYGGPFLIVLSYGPRMVFKRAKMFEELRRANYMQSMLRVLEWYEQRSKLTSHKSTQPSSPPPDNKRWIKRISKD